MNCPLTRNSLNYQQLQEMAKEIPEEPEQEALEAGASGDTNVYINLYLNVILMYLSYDFQRTFTWTADPSKQRNCACLPQKGVGFQDILNKYQPGAGTYSSSTFMQVCCLLNITIYREYLCNILLAYK